MSDAIVAPEQRDLAELERLLTAWLRTRMPAASELRIGQLEYPRGAGQSHETGTGERMSENVRSHDCHLRRWPSLLFR